MSDQNDQLVLISGESGTGKSASLMNIPEQDKWIYCNCESGKRLPFKNQYNQMKITDPYRVFKGFEAMKKNPDKFNGLIVDTLTFLMDMYESQYVLTADNTMKAWGDYQQYFKELMQEYVAGTDKAVIILAHTRQDYNEKTLDYQTAVPVKGALKNNGIEAYFSTVVSTKKVSLDILEKYQNDLLNITPTDRRLGYKHVFQTQLTEGTIGDRIRSPIGLFTEEQTYMDNDAGLLLKHLNEYYA